MILCIFIARKPLDVVARAYATYATAFIVTLNWHLFKNEEPYTFRLFVLKSTFYKRTHLGCRFDNYFGTQTSYLS